MLADLAGGHLYVLLRDGGHHVHGDQRQGRKFVRIEPGAQAVVALPEVSDAGDPFLPAQLVLDVNRRVIAEKGAVVTAVRNKVHDHHRVG